MRVSDDENVSTKSNSKHYGHISPIIHIRGKDFMEIQYGCECIEHCNVHTGPNNVPVAYLIQRYNKELKICTRCQLTGDIIIMYLFNEHTMAQPFVDYNAIGAFLILAKLKELQDAEQSKS